jgi:murein DD-endopeptidase MepM/ murein hydrolase activator NlpD
MVASALPILLGLILGATSADSPWTAVPTAAASPAAGIYVWPVVGPVLRGFEPPPDPFSAGHRGIDIGAPVGATMVAAQDGVVAFAGWVAGALYISIDHPDGVRSTYSWVSSAAVGVGQAVIRGQPIGTTGTGHPGSVSPHLHFGTRVGSTYLDPMLLLVRGSVAGLIHLAPLSGTEFLAWTSKRSNRGSTAGWGFAERGARRTSPGLAFEPTGASRGLGTRAPPAARSLE